MKKINIAIFVSGSGTNCENLIKYFSDSPRVLCAIVVSNKTDALALERAKRLGVPTAVVPKAELNDANFLLPLMREYKIDFIVLAGFLPLVPTFLIEAYPRKIVNLHPALLPKFGGKGMWGHHVVHYVTPVCDSGEIIAQYRCALSPADSVDDIAEKEHQLEMTYFPLVVDNILRETFQ